MSLRLTRPGAIGVLVCLLSLAAVAADEEPSKPPSSTKAIKKVYEDKTLGDDRIVHFLAAELNVRVVRKRAAAGEEKERLAHQCAWLVRLIAERPYPAK